MPNHGHYGSHGRPKIPHSREQAEDRAARRRAKGEDMQAYLCRKCRAWHIGHPPIVRTLLHHEWTRIELGLRAAGCMGAENSGTQWERRRAVVKAARAALVRRGRLGLLSRPRPLV